MTSLWAEGERGQHERYPARLRLPRHRKSSAREWQPAPAAVAYACSHLEKDFLAVEDPHGNKAECGERYGIREGRPSSIGNVGKRMHQKQHDGAWLSRC